MINHDIMKYGRLFLTVIVLGFIISQSANAQRFAYVDTEYILQNVPEYESAQKQLRQTAEEWRDEIRRQKEEITDLKRDFEAEKVLLPEETREQRRRELKEKEEALEQYREDKFGRNGELFQTRDILLQPIQDRIFDAVQEVARDGALDFVFDRAGGISMLYYSAQFDRSDEVLKHMGIDPPEERKKEQESENDERQESEKNNRRQQNPQDDAPRQRDRDDMVVPADPDADQQLRQIPD